MATKHFKRRGEPNTTGVDVTSFGAVGNGLEDDLWAIQEAINSLGADGGYVYFPPGTYIVGSEGKTGGSLAGKDVFCIELKDNITLVGEGPASCIKLAAQAGTGSAPYPIAYAIWAGTHGGTALGTTKTVQRANIGILNLKIDGDHPNQPSGGTHDIATIRIGECSNVRVEGCEIIGGPAETCYILGKHDDYDQTAFQFSNNYVHDTGEWGVDSLGVHMDRINGGVCSDNIFYDVGLRGVGCGKCTDVTITGNWIGRNFDGGIRIAGGDRLVISGNRLKDCNKYGIECSPEESNDCFDIDIHGNQIDCNATNGESGIICTNASRVNITGNSISTVQWDGGAAGDLVSGIRVVSQSDIQCSDVIIANNLIRNIDSNYTSGLTIPPTAIYVSGQSATYYLDNVVIKNNVIDDTYNGITIGYCDHMSVTGNVIDGATNTDMSVSNCVNVNELADTTSHKFGNYDFNTDETVGSGQDDYVLVYDDSSGEIGLEAIPPNAYVFKTPAAVTITNGSSSDTVSDVQTFSDGNEFVLSEVTGSPGQNFEFDFNDVTSFKGIVLFAHYEGADTHEVNVQVYNHNTTAWETFITLSNTDDYNMRTIFIPDGTNYISSGDLDIRFYHAASGNATHDTYISYLAILT